MNVLSINLAVQLGLWYTGYRPDHWFESDSARRATIRRVAVLAVGIVLLSVALGGVTLDSHQRATTDAATEVIEQEETALELVDASVGYAGPAPFQDPEEVTVTVGIDPGERPTEPASLLRERIAERIGVDATTRVRYVQTETG